MANQLQGLIGQPYMLKFNRYELKKPKALWQDIQPTGKGYASLKLCKADICSISHVEMQTMQTADCADQCFIDLKSSVWFTLGSKDETVFCDTYNFFQLNCRSRFSKH